MRALGVHVLAVMRLILCDSVISLCIVQQYIILLRHSSEGRLRVVLILCYHSEW